MKNQTAFPDYLRPVFNKAALALQNGNAEAAKRGFVKVTRKVKNNALVWYNLGLSHQHLGDHRSAIPAYRKAIAIDSGMLDAMINLGISYKFLGKTEEAVDMGKRALALNENHVRGNNLVGSILAEQGRLNQAHAYLSKSHAAAPDDAETRFNMAGLELALGNGKSAHSILEPLLRRFPTERKYIELQVQIDIQSREYDNAARGIAFLREQFGEDSDILRLELSLGEVSRSHFRIMDICRTLLEKSPDDAHLWNSLGGAYFQLDSIQNAQDSYRKALEIDPGNAEYANNMGLVYSSLGDKENAEKFYRLSISLDPGHAEAWRSLVTMKRFSSMEDADAQAIVNLWQKRGQDTSLTIRLAFALGKVYDDCGEYEKSFEVYDIGNALKFADSRIDLERYFRHIDRVPQVFDRPPEYVSSARFPAQPVFVLGMPRSGTTLVEQILSRHPDITGCGELPCIERTINRLEKTGDTARVYPDDFRQFGRSTMNQEAAEYQRWVSRLHQIHTGYYVDKMPFNFVHIWLIKALFPDSPIIHCRRHPLDVILSNYFQLYDSDVSFVYNLEALANYYVRYAGLMKHWSGIFHRAIYHVVYEELVTDHAPQARRLIEGIGLAWSDRCLDSKMSAAAVRTASIWQVRQGIYTRSKARWRNYEKRIKPAADILVAHGILDEEWAVI